MKLIINAILALIPAVVVFFVTAFTLLALGFEEPESIEAAISLFAPATIAAVLVFFSALNFLNNRDVIADAAASVKSYGEDIYSKVEAKDADYLAIAEKEVDEGHVDKALWSQALVKAKGVESQRKIQYMKLRARQLKR